MLISVHSEVSWEMDNTNRLLRQDVVWRLRRMSCENLSAQLHRIRRSTAYRAIVRLYNLFAHSLEVRHIIEDNVFDRELNDLYVFRSIVNAREER